MKLREIAAKIFWFLPFGRRAIPPPLPKSFPTDAVSTPVGEKSSHHQRQIGEWYLPVDEKFIEIAFAADFRSAKHQGDTIRLSALKALQRNVVRHASSGDGFVKLCRKRFKVVVQECIEQSREVAQIFRETGDPELALQEDKEIAVLETYLAPPPNEPERLTQDLHRKPDIVAKSPSVETKSNAPRLDPKSEIPCDTTLQLTNTPVQEKPGAPPPTTKTYVRPLSCSRCQTSARNWLFRHDADARPFPSGPNYQSKKNGRLILLCPDCLNAAIAKERYAKESPAKPPIYAARPASPRVSSYDGRYRPGPSGGGFQWRGPGYCQHCNRRAMPGGDVCYSCNPD